MGAQVRYCDDVKRGYIYFVEPLKLNISKTGDLNEAHEFLLDFDNKCHIVGIELEGAAAQKIRTIAGQSHIFQKKEKANGQVYYALRLSDEKIGATKYHPKAKAVRFHFTDTTYKSFLGIDIFDIDFYSEQYLVGK